MQGQDASQFIRVRGEYPIPQPSSSVPIRKIRGFTCGIKDNPACGAEGINRAVTPLRSPRHNFSHEKNSHFNFDRSRLRHGGNVRRRIGSHAIGEYPRFAGTGGSRSSAGRSPCEGKAQEQEAPETRKEDGDEKSGCRFGCKCRREWRYKVKRPANLLLTAALVAQTRVYSAGFFAAT